MNFNYPKVIACLLFSFLGFSLLASAQDSISGYIKDRSGQGIGNVTVSLTTANQVYLPYITTQTGFYFFDGLDPDAEITITPEKNDNHRNGVTTLDLVKIQKHILGSELFGSPYQTIAADVNNNQSLSAIDLVILRKLILGIDTELEYNTSWRFVRKDYIFESTMFPWPIYDIESIAITDIDNPGNTDFVAIKIGDVNGTAVPH